MSVTKPGSPFSGGSEPLEPLSPNDLQKTVKASGFASELAALENAASEGASESGATNAASSETLDGLRQIASDSELATPAQAFAAVRESARFMIKSRIKEKYREQEKVAEMTEELSDFVASDPFLHRKLLKVLERLKEK